MPKVGDPIPGTNLFYEESDIANLGNEVSVLGSSLAIPDKLKADQTLAMLTGNIRGGQYQNLQGQTIDAKTGQPVIPPEESAKTPEDPTLQDFIEYITPDGQTATIYQPEMNRGAIELLLKQGAKPLKFLISRPLAFDYGYGAPAAFPSENAAQTALNDAKNELDSLKKQFDSYRISDADLQNQISSISAGWDARIAQMENINKRREASLNTLGIRLGSRWTGGQFGEVVAEEERQGIARIGELEAQKQSAIQTAKKAARDQNWEIYVKQVELAEKQYEKQQDAMKELNKLQTEQSEKLQDQIKIQRDSDRQEMESMITMADALAPLLFGQLTNNENTNLELAAKFADEFGISPQILLSRAMALQKNPTAQNLGVDYGLLTEFLGRQPTKEEYLTFQRQQAEAKKIIVGVGGGADSLVQTILQNPELFNQLTPTDKARVAPQLAALGFTAFGKPLSDTAIKEITQTETGLEQLKYLKDVVINNQDLIGPIRGLAALNPYSKARQIQADIDRVKQSVGKALEGGVLRKEDEEKYKKILATITDVPETALHKINQLIATLTKNVELYKEQQSAAGRTVDAKSDDPLGIR